MVTHGALACDKLLNLESLIHTPPHGENTFFQMLTEETKRCPEEAQWALPQGSILAKLTHLPPLISSLLIITPKFIV